MSAMVPPKLPLRKVPAKMADKRQAEGPPSSDIFVHTSTPWIRNLSDLTDSNLIGNIRLNHSSETVATYISDQSATSDQRPWAHRMILSSRLPVHPQPPTDCDDSVGCTKKYLATICSKTEQDSDESLVLSKSSREDQSTADDASNSHLRTPIIILLMDPGRKLYELMQLWIDVQVDLAKDVLYAMQRKLYDKGEWKTDYDGLFQFRDEKFTQLLHILGMAKHHPQPYEVFIAKPWGMGSKVAEEHARELLQYFEDVQLVAACAQSSQNLNVQDASKFLQLSKQARARVYVPDGILSHYHACQFLSFSPPFQPHVKAVVGVDVLGCNGGPCTIGEDSSVSTSSNDATSMEEVKEQTVCPQTVLNGDDDEPVTKQPAASHTSNTDVAATPNKDKTTRTDQRRGIRKAWSCCRSERQLQFVVDGGRLPSTFECATPPMEESVVHSSDDGSRVEFSHIPGLMPLMFGRCRNSQQWMKLELEE